MKSIRRSLNKDKSGGLASPPLPSQLPPSPAAAVAPPSSSGSRTPPQLVIRARTTYRAQSPQELSYNAGDFFYVADPGRGGADFYDAHDPLRGSRGLVRRADFQELQKGGIGGSRASAVPMGGPLASTSSHSSTPSTSHPNGPSHSHTLSQQSSMSSAGGPKTKPPTLYAIVQYDFQAERPDELSAQAGEPIIVIAQSNHEWFVAKPITRLGGPGLIPVSFVEIRDQRTNEPVGVDAVLQQGRVPRVEEWKKQAADYKKASIPLGRFEFDSGPSPSQQQQQLDNYPYEQQNGYHPAQGLPTPPATSRESSGSYPPQLPGARDDQPAVVTSASVVSFHQEQGEYWFRLHAELVLDPPSPDETQTLSKHLILFRLYEDFYDFQIRLLDAFPVEAGRATEPGQAAPERILPYMPGPIKPEDVDDFVTSTRRDELDKYIHELVALPEYIIRHSLVRDFFAIRAGDTETVRRTRTTSGATSQSRGAAAHHSRTPSGYSISSSSRRPPSSAARVSSAGGAAGAPGTLAGLWEAEAGVERLSLGAEDREAEEDGYGDEGEEGKADETMRGDGGNARANLPPIDTRTRRDTWETQPPTAVTSSSWASAHNSRLDHDYGTSPPQAHHPPLPNLASHLSGSTAAATASPSSIPTTSSFSSPTPGPPTPSISSHPPPSSTSSAAAAPPFIKIKIFHKPTGDLIAIRVAPRVTYAGLLEKIRDRFGADVSRIWAAGAGGEEIGGDEELERWLGRAEKLALSAA